MDILAKSLYLTKQNLALALGKKPESLSYFIKKSLKNNGLIALKKGFFVVPDYITNNIKDQEEKEKYLEYLSNILREPSYVSLEYVLAKKGFIPESPVVITAVSTKTSRIFKSKLADFSYRQISSKIFFSYDLLNFKDKEIKVAGLAKALFDFLYFKNFDSVAQIRNFLIEKGRFNWEIFTEKDKEKFAEISEKSNSEKMKLISNQIKKIC